MTDEKAHMKWILSRITSNLATLAATVQAMEAYEKREGWSSEELRKLNEEAELELAIVFDPLFEAIDALDS